MSWYVALGGAIGSVARFLLSGFIQRPGGSFPLATLLINITGSLLLGFLLEYTLAAPAISREARALLTTGFCGGFTTFSTFSYETAKLLESGDYRRAALYVGLSLCVSLAGTFAGFSLGRGALALRRAI